MTAEYNPWAEIDRSLLELVNRYGKATIALRLNELPPGPSTVPLIDPQLVWNHRGRPPEDVDNGYLLEIAGLIEDARLVRLIEPNALRLSPWKATCVAAAHQVANVQKPENRTAASVEAVAFSDLSQIQ
jgi:hypothetical protein